MNNNLTDILTEVLIFPYDETIVSRLSEACKTYAKTISLSQYEACIIHLCLDIPDTSFMQAINEATMRSYPVQVYRALAGHVVGFTLSSNQAGIDRILYPLALRNVLKCHQPGSAGIINKCVDSSRFDSIEDYWQKKAEIPAIEHSDLLTNLYDKDAWADSKLEIEDQFENIKSLAKYYCRSMFEKEYETKSLQDNQEAYTFMNDVAQDLISRNWLYAAKDPVKIFKSFSTNRGSAPLSTVKARLQRDNVSTNSDIERTSVYRRYIYTNDYPEIGEKRVSPLSFGIAVFYELLYECLKSENYERTS